MAYPEPGPLDYVRLAWLTLRLRFWRAKMARRKVRKVVRSKRTIRRMKGAPLARKLAHFAIEARSFQKRLDYLVAEVQDLELTARTYQRALREHGWDTGMVGDMIAEEERRESDVGIGPCGERPSGACYLAPCDERDAGTCAALKASNAPGEAHSG